MDPFVPSSLDPNRRPHVYSEWWLALGDLGLGRKDVFWLGTVLVAVLIANVVAMVRPRTWRESASLLAVVWTEGLMAFGLNLATRLIGQPVNGGLLKVTLVVQQLLTWVFVASLARFLFLYLSRWVRTLLARPASA